MRPRPAARAIAEHYDGIAIRPEVLARLRMMKRTHPRTRLPSRRAIWVTALAGVIALAVMASGIFLSYRNAVRHDTSPTRLERVVLAEVRDIHAAAASPDVRGTFDDYQGLTSELGFAPGEPRRLAALGLFPAGARVVTLVGHPALCVDLVEPDGQRATLVQAVASHVPVHDTRFTDGDRRLVTWRENFFFYALVRPVR